MKKVASLEDVHCALCASTKPCHVTHSLTNGVARVDIRDAIVSNKLASSVDAIAISETWKHYWPTDLPTDWQGYLFGDDIASKKGFETIKCNSWHACTALIKQHILLVDFASWVAAEIAIIRERLQLSDMTTESFQSELWRLMSKGSFYLCFDPNPFIVCVVCERISCNYVFVQY